jgi:hypothetical protein
MGLIIICILLIVVGIIAAVKLDYNYDALACLGYVAAVIGAIALIVLLVIATTVPMCTKTTINHYKQDSTFVANTCMNKKLTEAERLQAINYAISWNTTIEDNKVYQKSFMLRFLCEDIDELHLLDINGIMPADNKLTVEETENSKE